MHDPEFWILQTGLNAEIRNSDKESAALSAEDSNFGNGDSVWRRGTEIRRGNLVTVWGFVLRFRLLGGLAVVLVKIIRAKRRYREKYFDKETKNR
jgi:hypothetical protein